MGNPLTPTPIVDKNGRRTVVHKRMSAEPLPKPLPVPSLPSDSADRNRLMKQFRETFKDSWCDEATINGLEEYASQMNESDLTHLVGLLGQSVLNEKEVQMLSHTYSSYAPERFSKWIRRMDENYHRLNEAYCDLVRAFLGEKYTRPLHSQLSQNTLSFIAGIEQYEASGFPLTPEAESNLCTVANTVNFEHIVRGIDGSDSYMRLSTKDDGIGFIPAHYIGNSELVSYVIEHPEEIESVLRHISDLSVTREQELMHRLTPGHSVALSEGAL